MKLGTLRDGLLSIGNFALVFAEAMLSFSGAMLAVRFGIYFMELGIEGRVALAVAGGLVGGVLGAMVSNCLRGRYLRPTPPRLGRVVRFDVHSRR